jgi:predicted ArsR family transcriptional regulator
MASAQGTAIAGQLKGVTFADRGAELADLLSKREGTLSAWAAEGDRFLMEDYNCPYRSVVERQPELCHWHVQLLSNVLNADVSEESCIASGAACCRHSITPRQ